MPLCRVPPRTFPRAVPREPASSPCPSKAGTSPILLARPDYAFFFTVDRSDACRLSRCFFFRPRSWAHLTLCRSPRPISYPPPPRSAFGGPGGPGGLQQPDPLALRSRGCCPPGPPPTPSSSSSAIRLRRPPEDQGDCSSLIRSRFARGAAAPLDPRLPRRAF